MDKNILIIDNYDSFTYNIVHSIKSLTSASISVQRNDVVSLSDVERATHLIFSPGPGIPSEAGMMPKLLEEFSQSKIILGICLGHQAIGQTFGGSLKCLSKPFHGIETKIEIDISDSLFSNLPGSISVGRYHSWVIDEETVPKDLRITGRDENGFIMSIAHKTLPVFGVQFHPESIMTQCGNLIFKNFLNLGVN
jgi:anthranilate synthase component 2